MYALVKIFVRTGLKSNHIKCVMARKRSIHTRFDFQCGPTLAPSYIFCQAMERLSLGRLTYLTAGVTGISRVGELRTNISVVAKQCDSVEIKLFTITDRFDMYPTAFHFFWSIQNEIISFTWKRLWFMLEFKIYSVIKCPRTDRIIFNAAKKEEK